MVDAGVKTTPQEMNKNEGLVLVQNRIAGGWKMMDEQGHGLGWIKDPQSQSVLVGAATP